MQEPNTSLLANPRNSWVPVEGPVSIGALFGDSQVSLGPDGELFLHSRRAQPGPGEQGFAKRIVHVLAPSPPPEGDMLI
jgi:hypothetical protein